MYALIQLLQLLVKLFIFLLPLIIWMLSRSWAEEYFRSLALSYQQAGDFALYEFFGRSARAAQVLGPVVLLIIIMALHALKVIQQKRLVYLAAFGVIASILLSAYDEWGRLSAYSGQYSFFTLIQYVDGYLVFGILIAAIVASLPYTLYNRTLWLALGAFFFAKAWIRKKDGVTRANDPIFGNAKWQKPEEMQQTFSEGGIIVGEAYRLDHDPSAKGAYSPRDKNTWGKGGAMPLLRYDGGNTGHALLVGGAGAGKTTSTGVPTCLSWMDSICYLDPAQEVGEVVRAAREAMGRRVIFLDPDAQFGFNALDWIDTSKPSAQTDIKSVATWLVGEKPKSKQSGSGKDEYFQDAATNLVEVILSWVLYSEIFDQRERTLKTVRKILAKPMDELQAELKIIHDHAPTPLIAELSGPLCGIASGQWSGVVGSADNATQWLSNDSLSRLVSGEDFSTDDFVSGNLDIFVQIPLKTLSSTPGVARIVIGSLLNAVYERQGLGKRRVLFMLDECYQLGFMAALEKARDAGRKFGISLYPFYQSVGQIIDQWGREGKRSWFESTTYRQFSCVQDLETAKELSELCGSFTALQRTDQTGDSSSGKSSSVAGGTVSTNEGKSLSPVKRMLIQPDEILRMRTDEQIIIRSGFDPIRCGKAFYFRRPEMLNIVEKSRFAA